MQAAAQRRFTVRRQSTALLMSDMPGSGHFPSALPTAPAAAGHHQQPSATRVQRPGSPGAASAGGAPASEAHSIGAYHWGAEEDPDAHFDVDGRPKTCIGMLLAPLAWIYARLFVDLREEDDDFDTILRKIVISAGVPLVVFPVSFAFYLAAEIARVGITTGGLVTLLDMFVFPLVWVPSYLYVRHTKDVPFLLIDTWLIATTLGVGVLAIALVEYPTPQLAFYLLVMAMLCRTPRVLLHIVLCAAVYATAMTNQAISGLNPNNAEGTALATVPDPYRGSTLERVAYQVTGMVIGGIIASAVIMQTRENARMMARSAATAVVARQVANQLATYDTDAAKDTLVGFARGGRADIDLVSAFCAIVENLELYRPHLPGWIMQAHEEERKAAREWAEGGQAYLEPFDFAGRRSEADDDPHGLPTNHRHRNRRLKRAAAEYDPDLDLEVDIRIESVSTSPQEGMVPTPPDSGRGGGSLGSGSYGQSTALHSPQATAVSRRPGQAVGGPSQRTPMMSSLLTASTATRAYTGKATFAMLHVDYKQLTPADSLGAPYDKLIDACCTRLHEVAALLHGIVHSIAGDTVLMSWSAINRTAVPETKCAKAMAQLAAYGGDSGITISGMAMTDYVRCHHYGSTTKLFGARIPHRNTLWAASLYARDRQAMLVDDVAFRAAGGDVEMFPADVLKVAEWRVREVSEALSASPSPKHSRTTATPANTSPMLSTQNMPAPSNNTLASLNSSMQQHGSGADHGFRFMQVYEIIKEHQADPFGGDPSTYEPSAQRSAHQSHSEHTGHGDEWMYVLQRRTRTGRRGSAHSTTSESDPIELAIRYALRGRYTEALEHVKDFIKNATADDSNTNPPGALVDETESQKGREPSTEHTLMAVPDKRHSGSSNGSDPSTEPPTHIPGPSLSAATYDTVAHAGGGASSSAGCDVPFHLSTPPDVAGKVPRVVLRLRRRLQQLIAARAGPEDFPTPCILGYNGGMNASDSSPLHINLLTPAASFTTK